MVPMFSYLERFTTIFQVYSPGGANFPFPSLPFHLPSKGPASVASFIVHNTRTSLPEESKIPALVKPGFPIAHENL